MDAILPHLEAWKEELGSVENEFRDHGPKQAAFRADPFGNGFCVIGEPQER